jgi:hypothetical protein
VRRVSRTSFGSRRKSTTSWSSAFASSTPATSEKLTDAFEFGSTMFGFTLGIIWMVRQIRRTRIAKKKIGNQVSAPWPMSCISEARGIPPLIGRDAPRL